GVDLGEQTFLHRGNTDLGDQLGEESAHHQAACRRFRNAPGPQVEQLFVLEAPGGGCVAGSLDLAGLDLQVGHRVGACAVGEHQVPVEFVGVGSFGLLADEHVPDPHAVCVIALERTLIGDPGDAVRSDVVDEQPVLLMLTGVGEVQAVHLHIAAGGGEDGVGGQPDHVSAQGHHYVPEHGVAAHGGAVATGVHTACVPVLQRD